MTKKTALYDFHVNAPSNAVKIMQITLNSMGEKLTVDNHIGEKTIKAINNVNPRDLHRLYQKNRAQYHIEDARKNPKQRSFIRGWLNRIKDMKYED